MIQACNIAYIEFLVDVSPVVTDHHIAKGRWPEQFSYYLNLR